MFAVYKTLVKQTLRAQIPFRQRLLHFDSVSKIESAIDVSSTQYQVRTAEENIQKFIFKSLFYLISGQFQMYAKTC